jgi:hypothetical protein
VAVGLAVTKSFYHNHKFLSRETRSNIIHGIALFPLLMLVLSIFSRKALENVLTENHLIIGVAGAVALFSILEDEFEKKEAS